MNLADKLYTSEIDTEVAWARFPYFDPKMTIINSGVNPPLSSSFNKFLVRFFPGEMYRENVGLEFVSAMNRGIITLNELLAEHLNFPNGLQAETVPSETQVEEFLQQLEERFRQRGDKHSDRQRIYESLRAIGLGIQVLEIDAAKSVYHTVKYSDINTARRFEDLLDVHDPKISDCEAFEAMWPCSEGIVLYGTNKDPFRIRVKYLTKDDEVRYGSIIAKMIDDNINPDQINDHLGVEFIVREEEQRRRLKELFIRANGNMPLTNLKEYKRGDQRTNTESSPDFSCTKFIWQCVVPASLTIGPSRTPRVSVPTEVQILTLEDYEQREKSPMAFHSRYKQRQFVKVFPVLYPEQIYRPILEKTIYNEGIA